MAYHAGSISFGALPIPDSFLCPILHEVMQDPVATVDGHVYERRAIEHWFNLRHRTSPKTNLTLPSLSLMENVPLRRAIEEYLRSWRPELEKCALQQSTLEEAGRALEDELRQKQATQQSYISAFQGLSRPIRQLREAADKFTEDALRKVAHEVANEFQALQRMAVRLPDEPGSSGSQSGVLNAEPAAELRPRCLATLQGHGHSSSVLGLAVLSSERLASCSWDKTVKIWDVASGHCLATLQGHSSSVLGLAVLSSERLASCSWDKTVKIWDVASGHCLATLQGHSSSVLGLAVLSSERLASCSEDKTVKIWDVACLLRPSHVS